jgi:ATP-dependent Lhr-like helicase
LWFSLAPDSPPNEDQNLLEEEELNRERVRLLLDRWGILTRPLLEREAPVLSWARLLPTIRRMELAGELVTGRFFGGVASLQFASPRIAAELEEAEAERGIYWMNAADPASPAGLAVQDIMPGVERNAPAIRRTASSRLCFRGAELLAVSNRSCRELEIFISPDDPDIARALEFVKTSRTRKVHRENKITVEKINGASSSASAYSEVLAVHGFVNDRGRMVLW